MAMLSRKISRLIPKKIKTKRAGYFSMAVVILFSVLAYSFIFKPAPKVEAATIGTSSGSAFGSANERHIVTSSNGIIVTFYYAGSLGVTGLVYSKSTDNGSTWSGAAQVDTTANAINEFSAAIDGNDNIYIVYSSGSGSSTGSSIYLKKLTYSAGSWTLGPRKTVFAGFDPLCFNTGGSEAYSPTLAINSSGTIAVIFLEHDYDRDSGCSPFQETWYTQYYQSSDDGSNWNGAQLAATPVSLPIIADGKSFWFISTSGQLWVDVAGDRNIETASLTTLPTTIVSLAYSFDKVELFYRNSSNNLVYRNYSVDSGILSGETTISTGVNDLLGAISTDSNNLWAVYQSYVAANSYNVVYKRYNGTSWDTSATNITTDNAYNTSISLPERVPNTANVPVAWSSGTANPFSIKAATISTTGGVTDSGNQTGTLSGSLTGSSGDMIVKCGVWYYNTVNIVAGMTVKVCASNGQTGGKLEIHANSVTIAGTIDGAGRGLPGGVAVGGTGGGGGAAGTGNTGMSGQAGSYGTNSAGGDGSGQFAGTAGSSGSNLSSGAGAGGTTDTIVNWNGGGGGFGGGQGGSATAGSLGGFLASGVNGDTSTDESSALGSGGGAGGTGGSGQGGGGAAAPNDTGACYGVPGPGGAGGAGGAGGKGGNGGAMVKIYSVGDINITGLVEISGQTGSSGQSGQSGQKGTDGTAGGDRTVC